MRVIDYSSNEIRGSGVKRDVGRDEKQLIKFNLPGLMSCSILDHFKFKASVSI